MMLVDVEPVKICQYRENDANTIRLERIAPEQCELRIPPAQASFREQEQP